MAEEFDHEVTIEDVNALRRIWTDALNGLCAELEGKALRGDDSCTFLDDLANKNDDIKKAKDAAAVKLPKGNDFSVKVNGADKQLKTMAQAIDVFSNQAAAKKRQSPSLPCVKKYKKYVKEVSPPPPGAVSPDWMSPSLRFKAVSQTNISISGTGLDVCASGVFFKLSAVSASLVIHSIKDKTWKTVCKGMDGRFEAMSNSLSSVKDDIPAIDNEADPVDSEESGSENSENLNESDQMISESHL